MRRAVPVLALAVLLASCATQPTPEAYDAPGFFSGLWNGFTVFFSLIGSLFWHVRIYAFPNSGFWYDLGFFFGFGTWIALLNARVWPS
jgi:hypothetical protein